MTQMAYSVYNTRHKGAGFYNNTHAARQYNHQLAHQFLVMVVTHFERSLRAAMSIG